MAVLLPSVGSQRMLHPRGERFTTEELQRFVADGGPVKIMWINDKQLMAIDENGRDKNKAFNLRATTLAASVLEQDDHIVGDALVMQKMEIEK